ncbi:carbonic anhydrase-related protein 11-like [Penaeus vannamei]|uniref:carbonic anhydrase-related protein 11-like n=1 Tax=Penaeus vannamei TaxID=6689 RepID=UPI00387F3FD9
MERKPRRSAALCYLVLPLLLADVAAGLGVSWDWHSWWTYDGISGPQFWGLINPEWSLCTHGRRQSPINLDPSLLLYDPNLRPLHIDKHRASKTSPEDVCKAFFKRCLRPSECALNSQCDEGSRCRKLFKM